VKITNSEKDILKKKNQLFFYVSLPADFNASKISLFKHNFLCQLFSLLINILLYF